MVGIIGYIGKEEAKPILLQGLRNLELIDYDSLGIATVSDRLCILKSVGKMDGAVDIERLKDFEGNIGIAHTRRATHGHICLANAHPHTDCKKRVAIVHNGIIENYRALKEELISRGHIFTSSTDSEVIAHLIEEGLEAGKRFIYACTDAFRRLEGCYAVLAISLDARRVVAFRKDLPLVAGVAEGGIIFSSDASVLLHWTPKMVYLQNNDVAVACKNELILSNLVEGEEADRA
mgnify:CR=1 FL=1